MTISTTGQEKNRAFTLIEIIIVMVIFLVMAGIAFPSFRGAFSGSKLDAAVNEVSATMRYAHRFAVMEGVRCRVNFKANDRKFYLSYEKEPVSSPDEFSMIKASHGRVRTLARGMEIGKAEDGDDAGGDSSDAFFVTFMPDGTAEKFSMFLSNGSGRTVRITTVPVLGRVKVEYEKNEDT